MEETAMQLVMQVNDHEKRLGDLERNYTSLETKIQSVENGQLRVENLMLTDGKEQKALMNKMIDQQFEFNKKKLSSKEKINLALITAASTVLGGGGVVALVQIIFKPWG